MTKDEALKLALEALEYANACLKKQLTTKTKHEYAQDLLLAAGTAIREALAEQPAQQQEPVAWRYNGKLHEFDPSDWATGPVTPLYTSPPAKPWVNPSLKEYEDIMLANITPRTEDERDGIMCALNDMAVLLKEKNYD